jgi:hypothetical protein
MDNTKQYTAVDLAKRLRLTPERIRQIARELKLGKRTRVISQTITLYTAEDIKAMRRRQRKPYTRRAK